ncbi:MAG: GDSL-type esterase/lipase family protein, partial [Cyclobacteriaceae bacterium]|nr:GDSL-type esterase/lipase family protein [Cyclobacteriaceae bacterium]
GRLETEVLEMISEIDAKIYILDCLPNLLPPRFSHEELKTLLLSAVRLLREKRPDTPILLAEHAGYTDEGINDGRKESFESVNKTVQGVYKELTAAGVQGLYHVPMAEFGQDINTTVDGTHQNDLGMLLYANGYEKVLREILHEPKGVISTTIPVTQRREPHNYEWEERHEAILKLSGSMGSSNVFMGNSILHFWGGKPEAKIRHGEDPWNKYIEKHGVVNMAFGWDRIENVLWRIYHDALEGYAPKKIFLMLGTNNMHLNTDDEIVEGLKVLVEAIHYRQPQATILLSGIFPRRNEEERLVGLNKMIGNTFSQKDYVQFVNPGPVLLGKDGRIDESNFSDGLHPNEKGYKLLGKAIGVLLD